MPDSDTEKSSIENYAPKVSLREFLAMPRPEIAEIVNKYRRPRNIALVVDGTRRFLQLTRHPDDVYSYAGDAQNEMRQLMQTSVGAGDILFDMGVKVVTGPLATMGNLRRPGFVPDGLKLLLDPLTEDDTLEVLRRQRAAVSFYGDLDYIRSLDGGKTVDKYVEFFKGINPDEPEHRVLVGLGISADSDPLLTAQAYSDFVIKNNRKPTIEELREYRFGFPVPPVDVFIRTNEVKLSGCLDPLLQTDETQLYFPVSPGVLSMNEEVVRTILYDYLFNRIRSGGKHTHRVLTEQERTDTLQFYQENRNQVLGVGTGVGNDIWISKTPIE